MRSRKSASSAKNQEPQVAPLRPALCQQKGINMVIGIAHLQPIIALIAGILILIVPRLLNFIVAIYLIIIGLLGLGLFR